MGDLGFIIVEAIRQLSRLGLQTTKSNAVRVSCALLISAIVVSIVFVRNTP